MVCPRVSLGVSVCSPWGFEAGFPATIPLWGAFLLISWGSHMSISDSDRLVSLSDAAQYFGVSTKTVRRWIAAGRLEGYRVGPRLLRVRLGSLDSATRRLATARVLRKAPYWGLDRFLSDFEPKPIPKYG